MGIGDYVIDETKGKVIQFMKDRQWRLLPSGKKFISIATAETMGLDQAVKCYLQSKLQETV